MIKQLIARSVTVSGSGGIYCLPVGSRAHIQNAVGSAVQSDITLTSHYDILLACFALIAIVYTTALRGPCTSVGVFIWYTGIDKWNTGMGYWNDFPNVHSIYFISTHFFSKKVFTLILYATADVRADYSHNNSVEQA